MIWTITSCHARVTALRSAKRKTAAMKRELWELELLMFDVAGIA